MEYFIYKIENLDNAKKYIGYSKNVKKRWQTHIRNIEKPGRRCNQILRRAFIKHGIDSFSFEIIDKCETIEEAWKLEIMYIEKFKTNVKKYGNDAGYNLTNGGDGIKGYKATEEQKRKKSEQMMGENNPFYGKQHSPETRESISLSLTGKVQSTETRKKRSESCKKAPNSGKFVKGSIPKIAKLSFKTANQIRKEYTELSSNRWKTKLEKLGEKYNVSKSTIWLIIKNKIWKT